jgi:hypothetical protein
MISLPPIKALIMTCVSQLCHTLQSVLTTVADTAARTTRFVKRQSPLTGSKFVQTLVIGWLDNPDATYEQLAQTATALGVSITAQGLDHRFTREAADCLQQTLASAVQQVIVAEPVVIPVLQRFTGVYLQDSTTIALPAALASLWSGCNDTPDTPEAALKAQVQFNLSDGQLTHLDLQAGRAQDKTAPMQSAPLPAGALRIADLGYLSIPVLAEYDQQGVFWLTRYQANLQLFDLDGTALDLLTLLPATEQTPLDRSVLVSAHRLACRLVALRVPPQVAEERRRKLHAEAKADGGTPSARRLALCDWVIFLTNVSADHLSVAEIRVLARTRWQIELLFKLWKSHGHVDESRSAKPYRGLCEVYAKLLAMVIQHWVLITSSWQYPNRSWHKVAQTIRQHALRLGCALHLEAALADVINTIQRCIAKGARLNPRKAAPNTYQLLLACGSEN